MTLLLTILTILLLCFAKYAVPLSRLKEDEDFWKRKNNEDLQRAIQTDASINRGVAKNIILSIGDGMGISTITAARIYDGQLRGESGEENSLVFEKFPHVGLLKTYSTNRQTPDSASTAFALLSGIKTKNYVVGYSDEVVKGECSDKWKKIDTVLDWALAAGKSVGIVTTDRLTGATPAAAYAHVADRYWTTDDKTPKNCVDIARQLIEENPNINVLLGGGSDYFTPAENIPFAKNSGRQDGKELFRIWEEQKQQHASQFVENAQELEAVRPDETDFLLGVFHGGRLPPVHKRDATIPSLTQMTKKALEILSKNKNGFFLLVEAANIDDAHHYNLAREALAETIEFNEAISLVVNMTRDNETLHIVTADHSHVFTIAGYSDRGNPILGFITDKESKDNKPATTLGYSDGPGWIGRERPSIDISDTESYTFKYTGGRPTQWESHGAEDVAIFARGPMAHLFHGVHENSYVGHVMAYAACIGETSRICPSGKGKSLVPTFFQILSMSALVLIKFHL